MFVSKSMTQKVITIDENATLFDAKEKMTTNGIRHLPVVDEERVLIGIVTDRDIRSAMPSEALSDIGSTEVRESVSALKAKNFMTRKPITISPTHTIQDALLLIQKIRVGALPVVDHRGKLTEGIYSPPEPAEDEEKSRACSNLEHQLKGGLGTFEERRQCAGGDHQQNG